MGANDRALLKPPEEPPTDPALRLDDASDRVVVLAGAVIEQLQADDRELDDEDLADLRAAAEDVGRVLDDIGGSP